MSPLRNESEYTGSSGMPVKERTILRGCLHSVCFANSGRHDVAGNLLGLKDLIGFPRRPIGFSKPNRSATSLLSERSEVETSPCARRSTRHRRNLKLET